MRCVGVRRSRSACEAACENLLGCSGPPRTVEAPPAAKRVCALHSGAGSRGEQVYATPELLATRVAAMARAYAPANATFGGLRCHLWWAQRERGPEALARPLASLDDVQFVPSRAGAE